MYNIILVVVFSVIACHANPPTTKQGRFNRYFIHTRQNYRNPIEIDPNNVTASIDALLNTRNTAIIVHGHGGSATTILFPMLKDAFLIHQDMDVIVVDWSVNASQPYINAVGAVPSVGFYLANLINQLVDNKVVVLERLHLVGFDLGAHVVGFTGRALGGSVARITGLNPSGNYWGANSQRLNPRDARYVEVIHTDGGGVFSYGIGEPIGHVDFFPNGGSGQPGCLTNTCSHNRAWELMAATLTHNHLLGTFCMNWLQVSMNTCRGLQLRMGNNDFIKTGSGMFRVNTLRTYPF